MGLFSRLTASIRAKSRGEKAGDAGIADYPDGKCRETGNLTEAAIREDGLLKSELEAQVSVLNECLRKLDTRAREAVIGRLDWQASEALYRKVLISGQIGQLRSCIDALEAEQRQLGAMRERLRLKVRAFLGERQNLRARMPPGEAGERISESSKGLDEEVAAVRYAVDRARQNAAEARRLCDDARQFAARCSKPSAGMDIPDHDRDLVSRALAALKAEVNLH